MTALILPRLGMCKTAREAVEKLERMGAKLVGSGFYSRVYRVEVMDEREDRIVPSYDDFRYIANLKPWEMMQPVRPSYATERKVRIVKVALSSDPGGLMAARAAILTKDYDDLAPRYYGLTEFGGGQWMGELEVLTENPAHHSHQHSPTTAHLIANGEGRQPNPTLCATSVYVKTLFAMKEAHEAKGKKCHWDIHTQNVMMRGAQPVITDPVSAS